MTDMEGQQPALVDELLDGKHRALARVITKVENRSPGYRDLVSALHAHAGNADVIGVTGSPGAGKSTLVDKLARQYRDAGLTVGVIAIDPSSPFTGGSVLGDRIRMASTTGDMDVFFRSMSARGSLGGLSTATADAVTALDAFGKDKVVVETVGAGQNEIDIVKTADTVAVLVPPGSGDDVQMLKAGILEIGDVFVVNKADKPGADRTVQELREMLNGRSDYTETGHHGHDDLDLGTPHLPEHARGEVDSDGDDNHGDNDGDNHGDDNHGDNHGDDNHGDNHGDDNHGDNHGDDNHGDNHGDDNHGDNHGDDNHGDNHGDDNHGDNHGDDSHGHRERAPGWDPDIVETVAKTGEGVDELVEVLQAHADWLAETSAGSERERTRYAEEIRQLVREDVNALLATELERLGGVESLADAVVTRETDPYSVADEVVAPLADCIEERRDAAGNE